MIFSDVALSTRLEAAEGRSGADFVEARALLSPASGAVWADIAGVFALFDGRISPITQTFGLGMSQPLIAADLDQIEAFFRDRGSPIQHEVSPLADESTFVLLNARGYRPIEFTSVMFREIEPGIRLASVPNERVVVRRAGASDADVFVKTATEGWSEYAEFADMMTELTRVGVARAGSMSFLAEVSGKAIATGSLSISGGVALMAGASTVPGARNQGAQLALLEHRLRFAADAGCDLAMMCAKPGSASQRNAERHGFRIAYTRIKWNLLPNA